MKINPDALSIEIPLQNEEFLETGTDNLKHFSLRLLKVFMDSQSMLGTPVCGHISEKQFALIKEAAKDEEGFKVEGNRIYLPLPTNEDFYFVVTGRSSGTDYAPDQPNMPADENSEFTLGEAPLRPGEIPMDLPPAGMYSPAPTLSEPAPVLEERITKDEAKELQDGTDNDTETPVS